MICNETIEIIHSNVSHEVIQSIEDPDYRRIETEFRYLEDLEIRDLENGNQRLLE